LKIDDAAVKTQDHILVTGANGFLGRHVARLISRRGKRVIGIGHGAWKQDEWQSWGLSSWHNADVTLQTLEQFAGTPSAIIHCAGSGSVAFSVQHPLEDFARTVVTTANVLEYIRLRAPGCRIVYPSSASVYGTVEVLPIREDTCAAPISPYGTHKLMSEQLIASHARQFGTSAAIVRLFSVYGPDLRKQLLWDACSKLVRGETEFMGTGHEERDWLHVEDAARLMLAAVDQATLQCPVVNGGCGEGVAVRDIISSLSLYLMEQPFAPVFSGAQRMGDPSRYVADIVAAKAWGWSPEHSWREGIEEYALWWKTVTR
jgi:UDP-glucose 4-epimerase